MQDIIAYVCAAETLGSFRDAYGVKEVAAPTLIRGGEYCLRLRLFAESGRNDPVPLSQFDSVESFVFAMDSDWDDSTTCKIIADNDNISVSSVTVPATDDREQLICTEIAIPLPATNTQEVIDFIGNRQRFAAEVDENRGRHKGFVGLFCRSVAFRSGAVCLKSDVH